MRARSFSRTATLSTALLLSGCAIGPNYKRPDTAAPQAFRGQDAPADNPAPDETFWTAYNDPALTKLVEQARSSGFDARIAFARMEQSRALYGETHGLLFPGVGYAGNADRGRNALLGNPYTAGGGSTGNGFDGYLAATWELDLWGRVRRLNEGAKNAYLASDLGRNAVLVSLTADVATAYFELLELDDALAIAKNTTDSFGESLRLFNRQLEGGVVSRLDTETAEAALDTSASRIPDIERQITLKENQISVLIGANPGPIERGTPLAQQVLPPDIPLGLPSSLLERRPDVLQAEALAKAANAGIGATIGSFLPRIGLSALFGAVSPDLNNITAGHSTLWSVGAGVTGPLFQGGSLHGQYDQAKAQWEIAKLQYQEAALNAFTDVANALVNRSKLAEVREKQEKAVHAYEEAVALATQRYKAGKASYFEVIQAQNYLFPAQVSLAETRKNQLTSTVQLYKALGGGWKPGAPGSH
ncbi:MAG TPA: efflux transporter outer membrane subunit [Opitutaceae bacterium]|jgi:multidrug efflux system outer membrane protein|nr:efflux transporter outer membrane subunit [Opitutaceae bacterium]